MTFSPSGETAPVLIPRSTSSNVVEDLILITELGSATTIGNSKIARKIE
jgi:hypothetical protein